MMFSWRSGATSAACLLALLVRVAHVAHAGSVEMVDATQQFVKSTESTFDHMVVLEVFGAEETTLHWNDVIAGETITMRLVHTSVDAQTKAGWLGLAISPGGSGSSLDVGSDAMIGLISTKKVLKYNIKTQSEVTPHDDQTLIASNTQITQHAHDDGRHTTVLTFEKKLNDEPDDVPIQAKAKNTFLWAIGDASGVLGMHTERGGVEINFETVANLASKGKEGAGGTSTDDDRVISDGEDIVDIDDTLPVLNPTCPSIEDGYDSMVKLSSGLSLHWSFVNGNKSVTMKAIYDGAGWVAIGVTPNGDMIGAEAVIGLPDEGTVQKYELNDKSTSSITPLEKGQDTLKGTSITQANGKTILKFEKILKESGELEIKAKGETLFMFAVGNTNALSFHKHRGAVRLDLSKCGEDKKKSDTTNLDGLYKQKKMWAAHGFCATVAWAILTPLAISTAWFRTLVPSSWIYIHVFSQVMSFSFTVIAVILAVTAMSLADNPRHFSYSHHWMGLLILILASFQVIGGFLRPSVDRRDPYDPEPEPRKNWYELPTSPRELWHLTHRGLGITLLVAGLWQLNNGLALFMENFRTKDSRSFLYVYIGLFACSLVSLKMWILYDEYKATRGIEAVSLTMTQQSNANQRRGTGTSSTLNMNHSDMQGLVPVQFGNM
eukprot:CAMPEP_0198290508 /NCGR_PEP_ID=MMETSP1449-20131203/8346_1 /TAXON_ID=420275 /ORGANISM="Attheya septentrionalis, Strain CCMP2084" /LENGTH=661 /DNA_ID=CAMNT_0043989017 /DNA_START=178 /DNA_END=2163 /DNA_ORIENTATION=+